MAETKKRIIQYNEETTPALDDYLIMDSPTAGTRKILASNIGGGSGGGGINYSTEEQDTGLLWVDGRKIYQKTYSQVLNQTMSNGSTWYAMNDLNGKEIIDNETFYKSGTIVTSGVVNIQGPDNAGVGTLLTSINLSSGGTLTSTIRYVKTSEIV